MTAEEVVISAMNLLVEEMMHTLETTSKHSSINITTFSYVALIYIIVSNIIHIVIIIVFRFAS